MYKYMKMLAMAVFHSMKVWYVVSSITSGFVSKQNNTEPSPKLMTPIPHYQFKDPRTKRKWDKPLWLMPVHWPLQGQRGNMHMGKNSEAGMIVFHHLHAMHTCWRKCVATCAPKTGGKIHQGVILLGYICKTQTHKDTDLGRVEGHQWLRKLGTGSILLILAPILATVTARSPVIKWLPPGSGT